MQEFEPATEEQALKDIIVARMRRDGGISFRDFMELALYHPQFGYYCSGRQKMGRSGDYLTSPELSPVFPALMGRQIREMWEGLGKPEQFDLVEVGAGTGALCRDLLRWARRMAPGFLESLRYQIVEVSAALATRQRDVLEAEPDLLAHVSWLEGLPSEVEGCIVSNELLDSVPVHRVTVAGGKLMEIFVSWAGASFVEELRPACEDLCNYFRRLDLFPEEGYRTEVNLQAIAWMREAATALDRGFLCTLDYGYEAAEFYAPWRTGGTLMCFYEHSSGCDPYRRLGKQDMTSHVDFTSVRRAGEEAGLKTLGMVSQAEFLTNLGIGDVLRPAVEGGMSLEEYYARRREVMELLDPAGLGRIRVLIQSKRAGERSLRGLVGGGP